MASGAYSRHIYHPGMRKYKQRNWEKRAEVRKKVLMKNWSVQRCTHQGRVKTRGTRSPSISLWNINVLQQVWSDGDGPETDLSQNNRNALGTCPKMLRIQHRIQLTINNVKYTWVKSQVRQTNVPGSGAKQGREHLHDDQRVTHKRGGAGRAQPQCIYLPDYTPKNAK